MTRWPAPYRCKKRLSKAIGCERAASIQTHLTFHTISVAKELKKKGMINLKLAIEGIGQNKAKRWGKSLGIENISIQGKGTLGLRMRREVIKIQREHNFRNPNKIPTIIIGADLADLCEMDLMMAIKALKRTDLVIGPAKDGGFWLLGLSGELVKPVTSVPFSGINWGSSSVLKETICNAEKNYISYELINFKNDLDQLSDMHPWLK